MPKKGAQNSLDIESILKNFKKFVNATISDANSQADVDIKFAELIDIFRTTTDDINYKLEALTLIISELLKKHEFDQADATFSQYYIKLKDFIQFFDKFITEIDITLLGNGVLNDSTRPLYRKRLSNYNKEWKAQKTIVLNELSKLKKKIETDFDNWIAKSKKVIEKSLSKLKSLDKNINKKFSNFSQLVTAEGFTDAEKIIKRTEERVQTELKDQRQKLTEIPPELVPLLEDSITKWEQKLNKLDLEFPILIDPLKKQLQTAIILDNISKLKEISVETGKELSIVPSYLKQKQFLMARTLLRDTESRCLAEFENQSKKIAKMSPDLNLNSSDLVENWMKELTETEFEIKYLISSKMNQLETAIIEDNILNLEQFSLEANEKISTVTRLFEEEKFASGEKGLRHLEKEITSEFKKQKEALSQIRKGSSPTMDDLVTTWKESLEQTEKKFQNLIFEMKNKYIQLHIPHLLNKVDLLIQQNVEFLNNFLEDYQKKAMNQFKSHFNEPIESIRQLIKTQKKTFLQELNNKKDHVQLVFARYESYPLEEKKQQWANESKALLDCFNKIQTKIFSLLEDKDQINKLLDKYYETAQPAYGYKVPIKVLSEILEIPEDRLEFLFVELISHQFVSGEIDPVTKVIVLAPRVPPEKKQKLKMQPFQCMVCNLTINPSKEEIVYCPHCNSPAHRTHLIEWIKIKSTCPNCKRTIKIL